ncbi:N-acetyllactosaminide 3-alpha-galactosyltransferase [Cooperia oncophora]
MHRFLTKQKLDYSIIVVEQIENQTFNRAKLLNVGFMEANKIYKWQCYLFHDVDLLPEDDRNLHTCPTNNPRHMAVAVNKFDYKLLYEGMFGTSSALTLDQFKKTNGFSNRYWGWGGEDDDMYKRIVLAGYKVERYNHTIARYTMIRHEHEPQSNPINPCRYKLLEHTKKDWRNDGLNTLNYKVVNITFENLFTHIVVDLLEATERPPLEKVFCH